jgi:hypothetical protein
MGTRAWTKRAIDCRVEHKPGVEKLILGSYDELTAMDIQNLMELIDGAVEEGLTKVEFLAGVFSDVTDGTGRTLAEPASLPTHHMTSPGQAR